MEGVGDLPTAKDPEALAVAFIAFTQDGIKIGARDLGKPYFVHDPGQLLPVGCAPPDPDSYGVCKSCHCGDIREGRFLAVNQQPCALAGAVNDPCQMMKLAVGDADISKDVQFPHTICDRPPEITGNAAKKSSNHQRPTWRRQGT